LLSVGCSWSAVVERRTSLAVLEKDGYLENMKILQDPRNREILKKVGITPILPMDPESDFPADLKAEASGRAVPILLLPLDVALS
jgi:hypothetical protein